MTFFKKQNIDYVPIVLPVNYNKISYSRRYEIRNEYEHLQKGMCYYCQSSLYVNPPLKILNKTINLSLYPKGFFKHPIHLHHDHNTEMTIGVVHAYCNAVLWEYENE